MQRLSLSACNLDTMRRNLVIVVLALAVCRSAAAQNAPPSSTAFHWLDAVKDAALFERIKVSFADELTPDDPERVKPVVAQLYKKTSRIGDRQRNVARSATSAADRCSDH